MLCMQHWHSLNMVAMCQIWIGIGPVLTHYCLFTMITKAVLPHNGMFRGVVKQSVIWQPGESCFTHLTSMLHIRVRVLDGHWSILACRLFGTKPLPEPMLTYGKLDTQEQTAAKFESKYKTFHSWKCIWKRADELTVMVTLPGRRFLFVPIPGQWNKEQILWYHQLLTR